MCIRDRLGGGPYPQVSGVRFQFDARQPSGARVIGPLTRDDGRVIAPNDTVRLSFVTYPACRSGDGYRIPEAAAVCDEHERTPANFPRTADLVMQHLERMNGRIVMPPTGRVRRLDL